eukprot:8604712-Ditylum_brightwellii.AAC.1
MGKAVYDRLTNEFIACILINVSRESINDVVSNVKILNREDGGTRVTVIKWDDEGTVVASPELDWSTETEPTTINDPRIERGLSLEDFKHFKSLVDFREVFDPEEVCRTFEDAFYETDGLFVSAYPLPVMPDKYRKNYFPQFMVILSIETQHLEKAFDDIEDLAKETEK